MKINDISIKTQLRLGLALMLFFVLVMGTFSYIQSGLIHQQTITIFDHPLQVSKTLGALKSDILTIRVVFRDLVIAENVKDKHFAIQQLEILNADTVKRFNELYVRYLGPKTDIDNAYNAYLNWKLAVNEITQSVLSGNVESAKQSLRTGGSVEISRNIMISNIKIIEDFSIKKADELYDNSHKHYYLLNRQMLILFAVFLLLSMIISVTLMGNIRDPLMRLNEAARLFKSGNLSSRSSFIGKNEFGVLTSNFNDLADSIQKEIENRDKITNISKVMLSVDESREFFSSLLYVLSQNTGSQIAAVYLLSEDNQNFQYYESVGLDGSARNSFSAHSHEGEFGAVISSRKIQHIKDISDDTRFVFNTVSGNFIPKEIITIPIISGGVITAIISLASVNCYSNYSISLVYNMIDTMSARIGGVLANHKILMYLQTIEGQNQELDAQKSELAAQKAELVQQNMELEMQKNHLSEASRLKTHFLSNMSHELRTPLNSVIALSGVLYRRLADKIPKEEHSYLEIIERNGKNLLMLINDILDISRIEAGREEINISRFSINNLIKDAMEILKPQADQKDIDFLFNEDGPDFVINSDATKCYHILQNLIANAVKFTDKGKVEVLTSASDKFISITVKDTGIGIEKEHLRSIFDEFRQGDGSTSRKYGGTGLGLAIAKKYTEMLGGTISVNSVPNKGAEFIFTLPLCQSGITEGSATETTEDINRPVHRHSNTSASFRADNTILLVEDSEPAIIQIKDLMEEIGYKIQVANNAVAALELIDKKIPDAMILDLMLPGIDGFELLQTIRNNESTGHIPVLILTAKHITKEELKFLKRNNIHQLIQKGDINRIELQNAIDSMLKPEPPESKMPVRPKQSIEGKPVILVIEDNMDNMITVRAILEEKHSVIEAEDGYEGIEKAKKYIPNLILIDISLPGIDGIETFKQIRKIKELEHIPIFALTASAMESDREAIMSHGFDAFIAKPIIELDFLKIIGGVLNGK